MLEMLLNIGISTPQGAAGQVMWTTPGTYTWVVPEGVTSICVVMASAGARGSVASTNAFGGYGGGVLWKNNIAVTPGDSYTIVVGNPGTEVIVQTTNIASNVNDTSLRSSAFDIWVGAYRNASIAPTTVTVPTNSPPPNVGGGFGGVYDTSDYAKLNHGGSAGELNVRNGTSGTTAPRRGINLATGQMVVAAAPYYFGANAGGGGSSVPKAQNGGVNNGSWPGGNGAVRIIWGNNRWYPDRNIADIF